MPFTTISCWTRTQCDQHKSIRGWITRYQQMRCSMGWMAKCDPDVYPKKWPWRTMLSELFDDPSFYLSIFFCLKKKIMYIFLNKYLNFWNMFYVNCFPCHLYGPRAVKGHSSLKYNLDTCKIHSCLRIQFIRFALIASTCCEEWLQARVHLRFKVK